MTHGDLCGVFESETALSYDYGKTAGYRFDLTAIQSINLLNSCTAQDSSVNPHKEIR